MTAVWPRLLLIAGLSVVFGGIYGVVVAIPLGEPIGGAIAGAFVGVVLAPIAAACLWRKSIGRACSWVFVPTFVVSMFGAALPPRGSLAIVSFYVVANLFAWILAKNEWPLPPPRGRCGSCDYDLTGLKGDRCPECGAPIPAPVPSER